MDIKSDDDKPEANNDGYVTEESEGDFVDITEIKHWAEKDKTITSQNSEKQMRNHISHNLEVKRSQTVRSSMKSPLSGGGDRNCIKAKRTISFNIQPSTKPQVDIEPPKDERLRNLFASSRWSTSSSEPETPQKSQTRETPNDSPNAIVVSSSPDGDVIKFEIIDDKKPDSSDARNVTFHPEISDHVRWKSKSLGRNEAKKVSSEIVVKRRHSVNEITETKNQPVILRDSAIDLISDDDHSDAYTAVSLAGEKPTPRILIWGAVWKQEAVIFLSGGDLMEMPTVRLRERDLPFINEYLASVSVLTCAIVAIISRMKRHQRITATAQ